MECINLKERFDDRYRVSSEVKHNQDPWLYLIKCSLGHIYPHGGEMLGAAIDKHPTIARRLASQDYITIHQDGDDGMNLLFHVDDFDKVAEVMKPYKRHSLTDEQRKARVKNLQKNAPPDTKYALQFKKGILTPIKS